jgi:hypothetical protein
MTVYVRVGFPDNSDERGDLPTDPGQHGVSSV